MKNITKREIIRVLKDKKEYSKSGMTIEMIVEEIFKEYPKLVGNRHLERCQNLVDTFVKNKFLFIKEISISGKKFYKKT